MVHASLLSDSVFRKKGMKISDRSWKRGGIAA
jgi:hypothetical protein